MILYANMVLSLLVGLGWSAIAAIVALLLKEESTFPRVPLVAIVTIGVWAFAFRLENVLWTLGNSREHITFLSTGSALVTNIFTVLTAIVLLRYLIGRYLRVRRNRARDAS